jgi:hypothetical protein
MTDIRVAGRMGRGVYACRYIPAGTLLGQFAAIEIGPRDQAAIERTVLNAYLWQHKQKPEWGLLPFGWICFLNHSRMPNCETHWLETPAGWLAELRSLRPIAENAQLFIDYACSDEELGFMPDL